MRLPSRIRALVAGAAAAVAVMTVAAAGDGAAPVSEPPVAAVPTTVNFATVPMEVTAEDRPTVSPSRAVDASEHRTATTAASPPPPPPPPPPAVTKESPFSLVHSASSNDAVDLLEIVRTNATNAPRVSFESMTNTSAWRVDQWENPLNLLSNMIANEHIAVDADNVRVAVQLTDPAKVVNVAFTKTNDWRYGPTLVLGDHALDGLTRIKQLEFSNFNISFEGSKWLPPDTTLKRLAFNKSIIASFAMDKQYTVLRVEIRDSVLKSFPAWLLQQSMYAEALTIESCTFTEPLILSFEDLQTLQILPSVTLSQNKFPRMRLSDCVDTALYEGYDVCLTTPTNYANEADLPPRTFLPEAEHAVGIPDPSTPHPSVSLNTLPPTAPLSGANLSSSRNAFVTLGSVLGVVCAISLVVGFIWLRRRHASSRSDQDDDESAVSYHSDKFYHDVDAGYDDDDVVHGVVRDVRYSQRATTVGMGVLSDVDLGPRVVKGETRLGTSGLWKADYQGDTVAAMRVNVESLRDRGRDIEAIVASCVALRHPNVVEFLGTSMATSDEMWLVAEYMAKGNLLSIMAKKKLEMTWEILHKLSLQLATALAFVQSMRDALTTPRVPTLSSRSILFDGELNCKLDGLEFAQYMRDYAAPVLSFGQNEIPYRAPEVLRQSLSYQNSSSSSPLSIDEVAAAEVFALGVILCELSCQAPVYSDIIDARGIVLGEMFIAKEVAAGRLRPAPAADVPDAMARLVDACLAYDPRTRPTITQIVQQLVALDV